MARTRSIKPSFFQNEFLAECEPMARLLFIGLWTLADRTGRLECRPMRIKAQLFPYEHCDVVALLAQLAERGFVQAYEVNGMRVLEIPKFAEHQRCHPDERREELPERENAENPVVFGVPGNPTQEPGNFPSNCAFYLLPSTSNPSASTAPSKPKRLASKPADTIRWSASHGWEGITDADMSEWAKAYPAADIDVELAKATQWLKANPKRATKSNWRRWVTTVWLTKCQDRGGTHRVAGKRPDDKPPPRAWQEQYRPAPYRTPKQSAALAASLAAKNKEDQT